VISALRSSVYCSVKGDSYFGYAKETFFSFVFSLFTEKKINATFTLMAIKHFYPELKLQMIMFY